MLEDNFALSDNNQITVIGLSSPRLENLALDLKEKIQTSDLVVGPKRILDDPWIASLGIAMKYYDDGFESAIDAIATSPGQVVVLASGDPGFFGILRKIRSTNNKRKITVFPAPSSISLAFARLSLPWDDAVVVSSLGRPIENCIRAIYSHKKVAVLTSPGATPSDIANLLVSSTNPIQKERLSKTSFFVLSNLGDISERVEQVALEELANRDFPPLSILISLDRDTDSMEKVSKWANELQSDSLHFGKDEASYLHRNGMITKGEVRAVVLSKLKLGKRGVFWDVGSGSGSIAIEVSKLSPSLSVFAIEKDFDSASRIERNSQLHKASVTVINGEAPLALGKMPDPNWAFVGGGGVEVFNQVYSRLDKNGVIVATFTALERAVLAAEIVGNMVEINVSRGQVLENGTWHLSANNPVFIVWGSKDT